MLHYNPRHVSSINMPIFRRANCIITASVIVAVCKLLYRMPVESRLQSRLSSRLPECDIQYYIYSSLAERRLILLSPVSTFFIAC